MKDVVEDVTKCHGGRRLELEKMAVSVNMLTDSFNTFINWDVGV